MRKAINENPLVQAGLIGVLALVVGLMLLMRMGGSSEPAPSATPTDPAATAATDPATGAATDPTAGAPTDPTASVDPATGAPVTPAVSPTGSAQAGGGSDLKAGPGLPQEIVDAYNGGKAVVLLIATEDGIDDRRLKTMVEALRSNPEAEVFVIDVKDVADYSRITGGVDVSRTPALVIMRPKALTEGPMPTAVVSYGYRGTTSVHQALKDALYKGSSDLPYYPK